MRYLAMEQMAEEWELPELRSFQFALPVAISKINNKAQRHPPKKYQPALGRYFNHQVKAAQHAQHRYEGKFLDNGADGDPCSQHQKDDEQNFLVCFVADVGKCQVNALAVSVKKYYKQHRHNPSAIDVGKAKPALSRFSFCLRQVKNTGTYQHEGEQGANAC